jgi:flagellar basal-body rod protein FlgG
MPKGVSVILLALVAVGSGACTPVAGPACPASPVARAVEPTALEQTGRVFDLAIQGTGFFVLRDPVSGNHRYARFGRFRQTAEGNLVAHDGTHVVEPQITIPTDAVEVQITSDGVVQVRQPTSYATGTPAKPSLQPVGQFQLARFAKPEYLLEAFSILEPTCQSGTPVVGSPGTNGLGTLQVGTLEVYRAASASDTGATPR